MPKLSEILFGKEEKREDIQLYTPEQQKYMDFLLQKTQQPMESGLSYMQQLLGGGDEAFQKMAAPEMRRFQEQIVPQLAQQFASSDALGSSAFKQSLGAAGAGLSENLAALRENLKMQAMQQMPQLAGMAQPGLQRRFETNIRPATGGFVGAALPALASAAGMALGGPLGGMIGGSLGGALGGAASPSSGMIQKYSPSSSQAAAMAGSILG